ncbi:MAG: N-acetylmuramic acid 6-phosphate etherase [Glaciecola sp.]|jgi:N-acetylmuramic acid 6-phosphate etherase
MFEKSTEKESKYKHLEKMSTLDLLSNINMEDMTVPQVIEGIIPDIENLVNVVVSQLEKGGRLFYMGAGTSGRLGVVDASECPPTFGVPHELVVGLIAGGERAIRKAVENAEDDIKQGWEDLKQHDINEKDVVIGIAASGTTPYVIGALTKCNESNIPTGCITCNADSPLANIALHPVVAVVGPEFVTGSTRMKAGTAQKLILNMLSTATMIKLGKVKGNKMVDMQLSNAKLVDRAIKMIVDETGVSIEKASDLLDNHGSVRKSVDHWSSNH